MLIAISILSWQLWTGISLGDVDPRCAALVRRDAPRAWAQASHALTKFEVEVTKRRFFDYRDHGKLKRVHGRNSYTVCWDPAFSRYLVEERFKEGAPVPVARTVMNQDYHFEVMKESEKAGFYLTGGQRFRPKEERRPPRGELNYMQFYLEAGIQICGISLSEILGSEAFRLSDAQYVGAGQPPKRLVRLEWEYVGSDQWERRYPGDWTFTPGARYWAVLDPDNYWLSVENGFVAPFGPKRVIARWTMEITYQTGINGLPFPRRVTLRRSTDDDEGQDEKVVEFGVPHKLTRPPEEFRLAFYGVPESALIARRPTWLLQLLLLHAGVVGVGFAIWLYWRAKRKKSSSS